MGNMSEYCRCLRPASRVYQKKQSDQYPSMHKGNTFVEQNLDNYEESYVEPETQFQSTLQKYEWRKGELIGQGSFGRVYMGMTKQGKVIAVKQIEIKLVDAQFIRSFRAEIDILSSLKDKNIVKYLGSEQTDQYFNILLEFVGGGSIAQMLKKFNKFLEPVVQSYLKQILSGLVYLHKRRVIHRDIKGANILVDTKGVCKLAGTKSYNQDFGCSNLISNNSNSLKGTPNWMAPEVVNQQNIGLKSDIWSLGCMVIEMITGKPPWGNFSNPFQAMLTIQQKHSEPPIPKDISAELRHFLECCLKSDPKQRWTAKQLLDHPFMRLEFKSPTMKLKRKPSRIEQPTKKPTQEEPEEFDLEPKLVRVQEHGELEEQKAVYSPQSSLEPQSQRMSMDLVPHQKPRSQDDSTFSLQ